MPEQESAELRAARAMRRAVLGDEYVDSVTADTDGAAAEFQDYITWSSGTTAA